MATKTPPRHCTPAFAKRGGVSCLVFQVRSRCARIAFPAHTRVAAERRLLVEAHEALNDWYDGFLFEEAAERLAWMGEQG